MVKSQEINVSNLIDQLIRELNLPVALKTEIETVYHEIANIANLKYCRRDSKVVAAVFIVSYQHFLPFSINTVVKGLRYRSKLENKLVRKQVWTLVSHYFKLKNIVSLKKMLNLEYVKQLIMNETKSSEAVNRFTELYELAKNKLRMLTIRQSILVAACVLQIFNEFGVDDAFKKVCQIFQISRQSLKKYSSLLSSLLIEVSSSVSASSEAKKTIETIGRDS